MPTTVRNILMPADGDGATAESVNNAFRELQDLLSFQQHLPFKSSTKFLTQLRYRSVAWNPAQSKWCAVGRSDASTNGISRTLGPGSGTDSGYVREHLPIGTAAQISDVINDWDAGHSGIGTGDLTDVVVGPTDTFVAVGEGGTIRAATNGLTWASRTAAGGYTGQFNGIAFNGTNVLCAVGENGEIQTSPDNSTWTHRTPGAGYTGHFARVRWDGTNFIAVGGDGEIQTSPDGVTWTQRGAAGLGLEWYGIACSPTAVLVVGTLSGAARMQVSLNHGLSWTNLTVPSINGAAFTDAAYCASSDTFCLVGLFTAGSTNQGSSLILLGNPERQNWFLVDDPKLTSESSTSYASGVGCDGRRFCVLWNRTAATSGGLIYFSSPALGRRV